MYLMKVNLLCAAFYAACFDNKPVKWLCVVTYLYVRAAV